MKKIQGEGIANLIAQLAANNNQLEEIRMRRLLRFQKIMQCNKDALKKRDRQIAEFVNKYRAIVEQTQQLRANIEDFSVKTMIGKGYFGNVHLVIEKQTNDVYAMKKIKTPL